MPVKESKSGPVLTIEMLHEPDRQRIVFLAETDDMHNVELCVDGVHFPVKTLSKYQFAKPDYVRQNERVQSSVRNDQDSGSE